MYIRTTYVGTLNKVSGFWCGFLPEGVVVTEKRPVLFAEEGYELIRISYGENVGNSVWLHDGDSQDNYSEVEAEEGLSND